MIEAHHPDRTFVHLAVGPDAALVDVAPDFWETIDQRTDLHSGRLVTGGIVDSDWTVWEMHPEGEELIAVTEGSVRFTLDDGGDVGTVTVSAPEYVVVPRGVWHTADALGPARLLIVTWGAGTQHRPR